MTFTLKCYQNNFMINNLNIVSVGGKIFINYMKKKSTCSFVLDCIGSIIACMAFGLLLELSRGIDLYLRYYSANTTNMDTHLSNTLSEKSLRKRR